ncbi:MAG: nuclear transport factor 2 family protein [Pyrinomonadaceae bacterium]
MMKTILASITLLLVTLATSGIQAQTPEKQDPEKPQTTTLDAWRTALPPQSEQTSAPATADGDAYEGEETESQVESRILDLEQRLLVALKQRDPAALKFLLADDLVVAGVNIPGTQSDKSRFIDWAQKKLELKSYSVHKTDVRVFPSVSVVTVHYKRQASIAGVASDGEFIVTNVWAKRGRQWQAISHHVSALTKM